MYQKWKYLAKMEINYAIAKLIFFVVVKMYALQGRNIKLSSK